MPSDAFDDDFEEDLFDHGLDRVEFDPEEFSGVARLFPLPAPSLFPSVVQPLHVFEERYRALMREAVHGDGFIAMAVFKPGWEIDYPSRPPLESAACLGKIIAHQELEDGRFNLLLAGVARLRLLDEIEPPQAFRSANVELIAERHPKLNAIYRETQSRLVAAFRAALPHGVPPEPLQRIFESDASLGTLTDLAAYTLPVSRDVKHGVLAEVDPVPRAIFLLDALAADGVTWNVADEPDEPSQPLSPRFPPPFSEN